MTTKCSWCRILNAARPLAVIVLVVAIVVAIGHAPLALFLGPMLRPQALRPPSANATVARPTGAGRSPLLFLAIGAYFLVTTILFALGGVLVAVGKLFKLANLGLVILSVLDNALLLYTRTMPNIFFHRQLSWSWGWYPVGTVQVLIGQTILIVLCAILNSRKN